MVSRINELNKRIQRCSKCGIHSLECNKLNISKGYGKLIGNGGSKYFIVAQNPSINRYSGQLHALGVRNDPRGGGGYFRGLLEGVGVICNDVYLTNIVKCSTDSNRPPNDEELNNCVSFLQEEIDLLSPEVIVAMGRFSYDKLLELNLSVPLKYIWHYAFVSRNKNELEPKYRVMLKKAFES